jgi:hypothetical protein
MALIWPRFMAMRQSMPLRNRPSFCAVVISSRLSSPV